MWGDILKSKIKQDLIEEYVLLASVLKWAALAVFIGLVVGFITAWFIKIVNIGCHYTQRWKYYYLLMPIAFCLSSFIVKKLAPDAEGHGTEKAIQAVNEKNGKMDIKVVPVKIVSTIVTIIFGGSVGEEGPATQIGAGIASFFGGILKMNSIDKRRFAVCGIAAGFVGVFGAPVGAAVFACEVLYVGKFAYLSLFPSLIASFVSYYVGRHMGTKPLIGYYINMNAVNPNTGIALLKLIAFGIIIGILAVIFIRMVNYAEDFFKRLKIYAPLKGVIGGILILILMAVSGSHNFIGIGDNIISTAVSGNTVGNFEFLYKMLATSFTLGSGGSGGILTPMIYIGSTAGSTWARLIHSSAAFYSAAGMAAFLAACANTPLAGMIMALEMFGGKPGMYASVVCCISYMIVGHKSIYPTQLMILGKTPSLNMDLNCEIGKVKNLTIKNKLIKKTVNKITIHR